jgi:heme A synthase
MKSVRRAGYVALAVAVLHLIFGAIVRITGSGMGCGDHWPKCYGRWFPPLDRPDLIIEVTHRYLASVLSLAVLALVIVAYRHRREVGVAGRGGPLRSAVGALIAVIAAALFGGVTVKLGNPTYATVAHWLVAMVLLALVAATVVRAGGLGGARALVERGSAKTARGALIAAAMAFVAVAMGGLTAKFPGGPVACLSFPLCGTNPEVPAGAPHVQMTHRIIAYLLFFHFIGLVIGVRKRAATEAPVVRRALYVAFGAVVTQILVAGAMIGMQLPPMLRSLHQAVGVGIWLSAFTFAYLARRAARE